MTFAEQQAYVARGLQDEDETLWTTTLIKSLLNQGNQDVCRRTGYLKRVVAFTMDPTESDTGLYIADFQYELDEVVWLQDDRSVLCVTTTEALALADIDWPTREGDSPTAYALDYKRGAVKLDRRPASALSTLQGQVTYYHPDLTDDGEECLLPKPYHVLPCYFALAEAYAVDNDEEAPRKSQMWRDRYEKGLMELQAQTSRNFSRARPVSRGSYL